mgnify:FL=1
MKKNEANNIQYSRSAKIMKRIIWLLCILLVLSGAGLAIVSAAPQDDSPSLELYKKHAQDNEAFQVSNMVPGDNVSQNFTVRIYHKKQVTLYFKGLVTDQSKNLGNVLQVRVTDQDSGKVICQGTFNSINNKEYSQEIAQSGSGQTDVTYQVDAWLDTSVGNAYQKAFLDADFQWYVKDDGNTEPTQPSDNPTTPTDPTKPSQSGGGSGSGSHGGLTARTGDTAHIVLWCVFAICALAIIILLIKSRRDKKLAGEDLDDSDSETHKKLRRSMFIAVLLALMLGVTTFALITSMVEVKDNHFDTGVVKINLNDGKPVISEDEYLFEPGMRVVKDFFIENEGSIDAYYKIYLEDVKGDLADVLEATITEKESGKVLYQGLVSDLTRGSAAVDDGTLAAGERKNLTIRFYFPKERGNEAQDKTLSFKMGATATQVRNNPDRSFE